MTIDTGRSGRGNIVKRLGMLEDDGPYTLLKIALSEQAMKYLTPAADASDLTVEEFVMKIIEGSAAHFAAVEAMQELLGKGYRLGRA